jgi:hypothetical protein
MSDRPDLLSDVYIACDCEGQCRRFHRPIGNSANQVKRCAVWISRYHLAVVARTTLRRVEAEERQELRR